MLRNTPTISPRAGGIVDECSLVLACDLATLIFFRFSAAPEVEVHRKEANALRDFCVFLESSDHASRRHARSRAIDAPCDLGQASAGNTRANLRKHKSNHSQQKTANKS
jgi:hypothetical protein